MKFVATEEIAAPIDHVWRRVSDLEVFEDRFRKRVRGLSRDPAGPIHVDTVWSGKATIMGKVRAVEVRLCEFNAPASLETVAGTEGMVVTIRADLEALGADRTRLIVTSEARARSLAARLLLQSVRLGRKGVAHRYKERIAQFSEAIESSYSA
ncbi:MAG: SRPBCC family protein [Pseudomonadota bacterium]